MDPIVSLKFI